MPVPVGSHTKFVLFICSRDSIAVPIPVVPTLVGTIKPRISSKTGFVISCSEIMLISFFSRILPAPCPGVVWSVH